MCYRAGIMFRCSISFLYNDGGFFSWSFVVICSINFLPTVRSHVVLYKTSFIACLISITKSMHFSSSTF